MGRKSLGASKSRKVSTTFSIAELEAIAEEMAEHPAGNRAAVVLQLLQVNHPEWF